MNGVLGQRNKQHQQDDDELHIGHAVEWPGVAKAGIAHVVPFGLWRSVGTDHLPVVCRDFMQLVVDQPVA